MSSKLEGIDDMFGGSINNEENEDAAKTEIDISSLIPFKKHPFKLYTDGRLENMVESIRKFGVINPIIVRPADDNTYEILAGHNRVNAAKEVGLEKIPAIIKEGLTDDEAALIVTETNFMQRALNEMLPSEKAHAFDMEMNALYHQGKKVTWYDGPAINDKSCAEGKDATSTTMLSMHRSDATVGAKNNISREMVRRFRRLIYLIPELLDMVDKKSIAISPAVDLSYLSEDEQKMLFDEIGKGGYRINAKKAGELRKLSENGKFIEENVKTVLEGVKAAKDKKSDTVSFKLSRTFYSKYFDEGQPKKEIEATIEIALEQYFHKA